MNVRCYNSRTIVSDNVSARRNIVSCIQHEQTISAYIRLDVQVVNGSAPGLIRSRYAESYIYIYIYIYTVRSALVCSIVIF